MIYIIDNDTFFAELPNTTSGSPTRWGMLFNEAEFTPAVRRDTFVQKQASAADMNKAREILARHIKSVDAIYSRLNEIFNLVTANASSSIIEHAYPRGSQVFLSPKANPDLSDIYLLVVVVDREFSHAECVLDAAPLIAPNPHLHRIDTTSLDRKVSLYLTGQLSLMERLQSIVRSSRRDEEGV